MENSSELTRRIALGPEIAQIIQEFEQSLRFNNGHNAETITIKPRHFKKKIGNTTKPTAEIEALYIIIH